MTAASLNLAPERRTMEHLREEVGRIASYIPRAKPVVYLDYPVHTNIGDLLIERGTNLFFKELGYRVTDRRSVYDFCECAMERMPKDATIVLHGGGNFGDLYHLHQPFRERIIERFRDHPIVMMPQTIHFEREENLRRAAAVFSRHDNLTVLLRDQSSLEFFRRHFQNPVHLAPDMAHFLLGSFNPAAVDAENPRTLLFARRDKETRPIGAIPPGASAPADWEDVISSVETLAFRVFRKLHFKHCSFGGKRSLHAGWAVIRDRLIANGARLINGYDVVVTNRLHAALFGLLLGRQVVMMDNSNAKLSNYYATWLQGHPDARFVH